VTSCRWSSGDFFHSDPAPAGVTKEPRYLTGDEAVLQELRASAETPVWVLNRNGDRFTGRNGLEARSTFDAAASSCPVLLNIRRSGLGDGRGGVKAKLPTTGVPRPDPALHRADLSRLDRCRLAPLHLDEPESRFVIIERDDGDK